MLIDLWTKTSYVFMAAKNIERTEWIKTPGRFYVLREPLIIIR